jgi:hypothetical protein
MKGKYINVRKRIYKKKVELVYSSKNDKKKTDIREQDTFPIHKIIPPKGKN